jgi:hypothetical protein
MADERSTRQRLHDLVLIMPRTLPTLTYQSCEHAPDGQTGLETIIEKRGDPIASSAIVSEQGKG